MLIRDQFPGTAAASISKFEIDGDVISLDGRDPLCTESDMDGNGRIRVRIRRSTSSAPDSALSSTIAMTPRASNLSGAEVYSVNTPAPQHDFADLALGYRSASPRLSGYASSDAYSLQPTPRASNFNELETTTTSTPMWMRSPAAGRVFRQPSPAFSGVKIVWESPKFEGGGEGLGQGGKDIGGT